MSAGDPLDEHFFRVGAAVTALCGWAVRNRKQVLIDSGLLVVGDVKEGTMGVEPTALNWEQLEERVRD